ncbi:hypothetical protein K458DRAFT_373259 [Lentithecium fluviatile CBS 122367]|uniref:Uncharacterized protein n=1 Tax=Lentithecium fluviatile CBS 122367 TaxID=1168545 RepID=A0A6G1IRJ0_9PLEO|nr:hypothetical protein K458DRAFT_373259 [Lentithecium fluviatile CBS 122367]
MSPLPVILCGRNPNIAQIVRKHMLPEYVVTHIILILTSGVADIPLLLQGRTPPNHTTNLGSQNYNAPTVTVVTGGGFDDEDFALMKNACKTTEGIRHVPWLRPDLEKPRPTGAKAHDLNKLGADAIQAFGEGTARRVKACLGKDGVLGTEDEVILF